MFERYIFLIFLIIVTGIFNVRYISLIYIYIKDIYYSLFYFLYYYRNDLSLVKISILIIFFNIKDSHAIIFYHQLFESTKDIYRHNIDEVDRQKRDLYKSSPFNYLYDSGNNQALLNCTGFDHEKFKNLFGKFCTRFDNYTFDKLSGFIRPKIMCNGRPRDLGAIGRLGLVLTWYRTRRSCSRNVALCFGQIYTPL